MVDYISPEKEVNAGLWTLFAGATVLLFLRLWVKLNRRTGLWYDDYILIVSWAVLLATDAVISYEWAHNYTEKWDDRMHILVNISSCGFLLGQAWSKTAFGVTLLKLTERWQRYVVWFCIVTMNLYMFVKVILQWVRLCDKQVWYGINACVNSHFRDDFKEGGNVYNIIMDFVFALFPWLITRKLDVSKKERIGLCITMSLGVVVAIVAAIRTAWADTNMDKNDPYYFWNKGMSNVWFSSEVAGTIMVQCIPVLRTLIADTRASFTPKNSAATSDEEKQDSIDWDSKAETVSASPTKPKPSGFAGFLSAFSHDRIIDDIDLKGMPRDLERERRNEDKIWRAYIIG